MQAVLLIHVGVLVFEPVPARVPLCGIVGLLTTLLVMRTFPYFELLSPSFLLTCGELPPARFSLDSCAMFTAMFVLALGLCYCAWRFQRSLY